MFQIILLILILILLISIKNVLVDILNKVEVVKNQNKEYLTKELLKILDSKEDKDK